MIRRSWRRRPSNWRQRRDTKCPRLFWLKGHHGGAVSGVEPKDQEPGRQILDVIARMP
jgi:hypothetical protein